MGVVGHTPTEHKPAKVDEFYQFWIPAHQSSDEVSRNLTKNCKQRNVFSKIQPVFFWFHVKDTFLELWNDAVSIRTKRALIWGISCEIWL